MPTIKINRLREIFKDMKTILNAFALLTKSLKNSQAVIKLNDTRNDRVQYTSNLSKRASLSNFYL